MTNSHLSYRSDLALELIRIAGVNRIDDTTQLSVTVANNLVVSAIRLHTYSANASQLDSSVVLSS